MTKGKKEALPAQPHGDVALVLRPMPWGDGPLADAGWHVEATDTKVRDKLGRQVREESMRARLLMLLDASQGSASDELGLWSAPVGLPSWSLSSWLAMWALQRPVFLQAVELGYTVPGDAVLDVVRGTAQDAGSAPTVTYGETSGQIALRYDWPDYEPLIFLRAPVLKSEANAALAISPDAWQQLEEDEWTARAAETDDRATELARLGPGCLDPGEPQPPGNPDLAAFWLWLGMSDAERQAIRAVLPKTGVDPIKVAWVDPKRTSEETAKPDPTADSRPASHGTSSCEALEVTKKWDAPHGLGMSVDEIKRAERCCVCHVANEGVAPRVAQLGPMCAPCHQDVLRLRVASAAARRGDTHFLETLVLQDGLQGRLDVVLWREGLCPNGKAPMALGPALRVEACQGDDVTWARTHLKRSGAMPHEAGPGGTCATCSGTSAGNDSDVCLVCSALVRPVYRGRCLACQVHVEAGNVSKLPDPASDDGKRDTRVYWARIDARKQAKACAADKTGRTAEELHKQATAALTAANPAAVAEREVVVPDEPTKKLKDAPAYEWEDPSSADDKRQDDGMPVIVAMSCPCGHNQIMPMSEARKDAPHGCPTCKADASAVVVVECATGKRWKGSDFAVQATDPSPGKIEEPLLPFTSPEEQAAQARRAHLEEINGKKAASDVQPDYAYRAGSGGRCEWDPDTAKPATVKEPGCKALAAFYVGARNPWKLCADCAMLPAFSRKGRMEIQAVQA